jgi:3,4-dihydroxy 2-butanone 4-phosphate synthase/GTP cyclohydrolase II
LISIDSFSVLVKDGVILGFDPRETKDLTIVREVATRLPITEGDFRIHIFRDAEGKEHAALVHGDVKGKEGVLTRVHSECMTGDLFGSLRCDCGPQLHHSLRMISEEREGILLYLRQEGRGIGIAEKLKAYNLQDLGLDTVDANIYLGHRAEARDYRVASDMLRALDVSSIRLLSNNPDKVGKLRELGVVVTEGLPLKPSVNVENLRYLRTKIDRMGHHLGTEDLDQHLPEMDDVIRSVTRARSEKIGGPFLTYFSVSALDGQLRDHPDGPHRNYSGLFRRLLLGHDAVLMDIENLIDYDDDLLANGPRVVLYDPDLKFDGKLNEGSIILHLGAPRCDFEGCILKDVSGLDGTLSIERVMEAVRRTGIRSMLLDGRSSISDHLLNGSGVDILINCIVPLMSGGKGTKLPVSSITFKEIRSVSLGNEIVYYGVPKRD